MIEVIAARAGLGVRRRIGRYLAGKTARASLSPDTDPKRQRKRLDATGKRLPLARGVSTSRTVLGGCPALALTPKNRRPGTLVYLHGGGYTRGSTRSHKPLISRLAASFGLRVIAIDYRLAPEHPFPAALDDATSALRDAFDDCEGPIVLAGDSAGGGLAVAACAHLRKLRHRLPEALIVLSPWADLSLSGQSHQTRAKADPMLKIEALEAAAAQYLGGRGGEEKLASPIFADLQGLPPTLIQVGEDEILLDDALRLHDAMEAAGVDVECEVWRGLWHDFQMFAPIIPEADCAVDRARVWLDGKIASLAEQPDAPQPATAPLMRARA